jgi:DNA-binding CsgD family transcriptional regulator
MTIDGMRREVAAFSQIALSCTGAAELRERALARLHRTIGFDSALMREPESREATLLARPRAYVEQFFENRAAYSQDLSPITNAAERSGGAAIDTEVLPARERAERRYYLEMAIPHGFSSIMLASVPMPGAAPMRICLARAGARARTFRKPDAQKVASILPVLALGEAMCALRASQSVGVDEPHLSPRERQIASLVARGMRNQEVAEHCGTSVHTVRKQLVSVFDKLGVASRSELAARVALETVHRRLREAGEAR